MIAVAIISPSGVKAFHKALEERLIISGTTIYHLDLSPPLSALVLQYVLQPNEHTSGSEFNVWYRKVIAKGVRTNLLCVEIDLF